MPSEIDGVRKALKAHSQKLHTETRARKAQDETASMELRETTNVLHSEIGELRGEMGELITAVRGLAVKVEEGVHQVETFRGTLGNSQNMNEDQHVTLEEDLAVAESRKQYRFVYSLLICH